MDTFYRYYYDTFIYLRFLTVEKSAFLVAMHWIIGGIQVQHDLLRRLCLRLDVEIHQQFIHCFLIHDDLLIAGPLIGIGRRQLQPIQRTLARSGTTPVRVPAPARAPPHLASHTTPLAADRAAVDRDHSNPHTPMPSHRPAGRSAPARCVQSCPHRDNLENSWRTAAPSPFSAPLVATTAIRPHW